MDFPHASNTNYGADNYTVRVDHAEFPGGWVSHSSGTHPCYDPNKDLVIPSFKPPPHYKRTIYMGGGSHPLATKPLERSILFFFRGDTGKARWDPDNLCMYSRCIRQTISKLYKEHDWRGKYNALYGDKA